MAAFVESCMRLSLFVLNFIFFCIGGVGVGFGAYAKAKPTNIMFGVADRGTIPIALIVIGCIVVAISFLGFCGAIKMSSCCLLIYTGVLTVMLLVEVGLAIAGYVLKDKVNKLANDNAMKHIKNDYQRLKFVRDMVDYIQESMKCCGVKNETDWLHSKWRKMANNTGAAVPKSCCIKPKENPDCNAATDTGAIKDPSKIYTKGCSASFKKMIHKNFKVILITVCCIAAVQLLGVIMGCCLMSSIKTR